MGTLLRARGVQQQLTWALMRPTVGPVLMAGGASTCIARGIAAATSGGGSAAGAGAAASAAAAARKPTASAVAASAAAAAAARGAHYSSRGPVAAAAAAAGAAAVAPFPSAPAALSLPALLSSLGSGGALPTTATPIDPPAALAALARRAFSTSSSPRWAAAAEGAGPAAAAKKAADKATAAAEEAAENDTSLELTEEKMRAITDKIPQRPVGVVEGTSYTLLIAAAFAVLAFFAYNFITTFLLEPTATQCFNAAAQRLRADPRITVRLGADITAYGQESASRAARQAVPHVVYKDAQGVEHCRLQFHLRGAGGAVALVNADMYKSEASGNAWEYSYLIADVATPGGGPGGARPQQQRLVIVAPK